MAVMESIFSSEGGNGGNKEETPNPEPNHGESPESFTLLENYPNPFNPATSIRYGIPEQSTVNIKVYDLSGRLVEELVNTNMDAGYYTVEFNGSTLPSGIYLYRMTSQSLVSDQQFSQVGRMLLLK
ncbi:MAG: T9SS type A sorting domain-containing protein [Candidatus Marinimicrobia bacterium]|nr:T9SS type A sorting domain-containing protein [Candidatus Neomarinimicrobiota bacterium]MCF7829453.1 T9SS type A sorting domain-containing protein [Candidatus Neomarinimicrobiota bacterium]MCF7880939.1 T9SS type A sorting domain-containing protein [Candidatus Neomarinimicrobiota bacterium]